MQQQGSMTFSKVKFYATFDTAVTGGKRDQYRFRHDNTPKYYPESVTGSNPFAQYVRRSEMGAYNDYITKIGGPRVVVDPVMSYDDIAGQIPYNESNNNDRKNYNRFNWFLRSDKGIHQGQLKLILAEIQAMLATFGNYDAVGIVVYAGSAPSMKLWLLMELFPNVTFLLIDPNETFIYVLNKYDLPHYVLCDPDYIEHGTKWGAPNDRAERERQSQAIVQLSISQSDMYESGIYKDKNVLYYDCSSGTVVKRNKPSTDSGFGNSARRINQHDGEFPLSTPRASQDSIDFVYQCATSPADSPLSRHKVFIIEEYMTDNIASMLGKANSEFPDIKIAFWSDIRTNMSPGSRFGSSPSDFDIVFNTAQMYSWSRLMRLQPDSTVLIKFRMPFFNESTNIDFGGFKESFDSAARLGYDFREQAWKKGKFVFFPGKIMLQAWCGPNSTETRLIVRGEDILANNLHEYDIKEYESKLNYYNSVQRFSVCHTNCNANKEIGFCHCNDCAIENAILEEYRQRNPNFNVLEFIDKLISVLNIRLLNRGGKAGHGYVFPTLTLRDLIELIESSRY